MHEGAMVKTGGCKAAHVNAKAEGTINPGDGENEFVGKCNKSEAAFIRKRTVVVAGAPKPVLPHDRLNNFNKLGDLNMSGLGAPD